MKEIQNFHVDWRNENFIIFWALRGYNNMLYCLVHGDVYNGQMQTLLIEGD